MKTIRKTVAVIISIVIVFVMLFSFPASANTVRVGIERGVNIRSVPGSADPATIIKSLSEYTEADLWGAETVNGKIWYYVHTDNGYTGYVSSDYSLILPSTVSDRFTPQTRVMVLDSVNVRQQPTVNSTAIASLWPCSVRAYGKTANGIGEIWYNIITPGGLNGYIRSDYVAEYTYTYDPQFEIAIQQFPYNYREGLRYLHTVHPNWNFSADILDYTLAEARAAEAGRKLLSNDYTSLPDNWRMSDGIAGLEPGYKHASVIALNYFLNPENFIVPKSIFMFMQQSYNPELQKAEDIYNIVNGSFLANETFVGYIMNAAKESNVNPYIIAGTILQEQGYYGSWLSNGQYTGAGGAYYGYYNFFNVSAAGDTETQIIENGLAYAKSQGWDTPEKSIIGGAKYYGASYVSDNQDTYFYKDFNLINKTWGFQYATNIHDALNNALHIADAYDSANSYASFRIPVYKGSDQGAEPSHTHTYGEGIVLVKPEVGKTGIKIHSCLYCDYQITTDIPALDPTPVAVKKGDINGDKVIDTIDGALLRMHFLGIKTLDENGKTGADINGDGAVDTIDGALLRMHFLGIRPLE